MVELGDERIGVRRRLRSERELHGGVLFLRVDPQVASKLQAMPVQVDVVETQLRTVEHIGGEADTAAEFL